MSGYNPAVTVDVLERRLEQAFHAIRSGVAQVKAVTAAKLDGNVLKRLCEDAGLLDRLPTTGRAAYRVPDPDTNAGKTAIAAMAIWLSENRRVKNSNPAPRVHRTVEAVKTTPLVPPTSTEKLIKWITLCLMELSAPLSKGTPAAYVREMQVLEIENRDLRARVVELEKELEVWNRQVEKVIQRRKSPDA